MSPAAAANAREKAARAWTRPTDVEGPEGDAATAVVAHGLLGNIAVIRGASRMLIAEPELGQVEKEKLLRMVEAQLELMQGVLTDLVRGLPSHALAALDDLRAR